MNVQARMSYLRLCGAAALPAVFKVEVPSALLGEMVEALAADVEAGGDVGFFLDCITALRSSGRFSLNARLMGAKAREALGRALAAAGAEGGPPEWRERESDVAAIRSAFGVGV